MDDTAWGDIPDELHEIFYAIGNEIANDEEKKILVDKVEQYMIDNHTCEGNGRRSDKCENTALPNSRYCTIHGA